MNANHLRVDAERDIARKTIAALLAAGYSLSVNDGGETVLRQSKDEGAIFAAMFSTDEDFLFVHAADAPAKQRTRDSIGWVKFVYGDDGWDVLSDYTVNLEAALAPANAAADEWEKKFNA